MKKVGCSSGVLFGGNANNGANCGFVYSNSNNAPSNTNANIGSRLYFSILLNNKNIKDATTLPLGKKFQTIPTVLVGNPFVSDTENSK